MKRYKVIDIHELNGQTAVTIEGNGEGLKNGITINEGRYTVSSVGIQNTTEFGKYTVMLIKEPFIEDEVII